MNEDPAVGTSATGQLGTPRLSTVDAIAQSLAVGPVASIVPFGAVLAGVAGSGGPFTILVTAIGVVGLGIVIAAYARRYKGAGGVYEYISQTLGKPFGLFSAGLYFYATIFLGAAALFIGIGIFVQSFFQQYASVNPSWWAGALGGLILVFLLNIFGIRISVRIQLLLAVFSLLPMLILAVVIIADGGHSGNTLQVFNPEYHSTGDVFKALLFSTTLFIGFELSASLGEETKNPRRSIPIALVSTVLLVGVFYVFLQYAGTIGYGADRAASVWGAQPNGFIDLGNHYVGNWLGEWINIALIIDLVASATGFTVTSARGWFALSRDGFLPKALSRTWSARQTPVAANLLILVLGTAMIVGVGFSFSNHFTGFTLTAITGALCVELIYLILAVGAIRFALKSPKNVFFWLAIGAAGAIPVLAIYGTIHPFPPGVLAVGVWLAVAGIALSAIWTGYLVRTRPDRVRAAAGYARVTTQPPAGEPARHTVHMDA